MMPFKDLVLSITSDNGTEFAMHKYIPKKTNFENINHLYINEITMKLNRRPRKKLNYNTPGKVFLNNFDNNVALAS